MKKTFITKAGLTALCAVFHIIITLSAGIVNILEGLNVTGISNAAALGFSVSALFIYIAGGLLVYKKKSAELSGFGVFFWGTALIGFVFYAFFNIFNIPISISIPNMTAFLRFMMLLFTLPLLSVNCLIGLIPPTALKFCFALALPSALFTINLLIRIKYKKSKIKDTNKEDLTSDE